MFISDPALRGNLRLDLSEVNRSLVNNDFKGATVLAGSLSEALLLWALQEKEQKSAGSIASAVPRPLTNGPFMNGNDRRGSQIRTAFEAALARAGITGFRFHDLRHTAASHMVMRGATLQEVKEILGHSDLRMTLRYAHLSPAHLRGAVSRLEGLGAAAPVPAPMAHELAQSGRMAGSGAPVAL